MAEPTVTCDFCAEPSPPGLRFCPSCGEPFGPRPAGPAPAAPRSRACGCVLLALGGALAFVVVAAVSGTISWGLQRSGEERARAALEAKERELLWAADVAPTASALEAVLAQLPADRRAQHAPRIATMASEEALRAEDPVLLRAWLARFPESPEAWAVKEALARAEAEAAHAAEQLADEQAFEAALAAGDPAPYLALHPLPTYATEEEREAQLHLALHPKSWTEEDPRAPSSPWVHAASVYLSYGDRVRPRRTQAIDRLVEGLVQDADPDRRAIGALLAAARAAGRPVVLRVAGSVEAPYEERLVEKVRGQLGALDVGLEVAHDPEGAPGPTTLSVSLWSSTDPTVTYDGAPREVATASFTREGWEVEYLASTPMYFQTAFGTAPAYAVRDAAAKELATLDLFPW